jgi:hypothetical protein
VDQGLAVGKNDTVCPYQLLQAGQRSFRRISRRSQAFVQAELAGLVVEQDEIRKRPAYIYADAIASGHTLPLHL